MARVYKADAPGLRIPEGGMTGMKKFFDFNLNFW